MKETKLDALGSHAEAMLGRLTILPIALAPLIILGQGNVVAGILTLPLLLLAPLVFEPRLKRGEA